MERLLDSVPTDVKIISLASAFNLSAIIFLAFSIDSLAS